MDAKVVLEGLNMEQIVSSAIMQQLTQDKKDVLIQEAIKYLMTAEPSSYGNKRDSPLQSAFKQAMTQVAHKQIEQMLQTEPSVTDAIQGLIRDAVKLIIEDNRQNRVSKIADKIIEGITNSSSY